MPESGLAPCLLEGALFEACNRRKSGERVGRKPCFSPHWEGQNRVKNEGVSPPRREALGGPKNSRAATWRPGGRLSVRKTPLLPRVYCRGARGVFPSDKLVEACGPRITCKDVDSSRIESACYPSSFGGEALEHRTNRRF